MQHAESDSRDEGSIESDFIRFEEDISLAQRVAESARFLLLLLAAGIVGVKGGRGCVMGAEAGIYKRTPPAYNGSSGPHVRTSRNRLVGPLKRWVVSWTLLWTTTIEFVVTQLKNGIE
jgi:hypothetical protein